MSRSTYRPGWHLGCVTLALALFLTVEARSDSFTNLFSTHFEVSEGYDAVYELIGQKGWVTTDGASYGGNGLLTNWLGSQAAFIGLFPLDPVADSLSVWQPINFAPLSAGKPLVTFKVNMSIIDSTTTNRDDFYWSVYNSAGLRLFTLDFYNVDLGIYYILDGTNDFAYTGYTFSNDVPYALTLTMDFARNSWSAALDKVLLLTNQPITTVNAIRDLGDIDAVWSVYTPSKPGDNFMAFDDYQVSAQALATPIARLDILAYNDNGRVALRLNGTSGARFAIETSTNWLQWTSLKTNTATDGSFDFVDTQSPRTATRFYRARLVP